MKNITSLSEKLTRYIQAGYSCFYLHTAETARAEALLAHVANKLKYQVLEYHLSEGKIDFANKSIQESHNGRLEQSLKNLFDEDLEQCLILIKNAKLALENNPVAIARLQYLIEKIERHHSGECAIILQSAELYIPADLEPFVTLLEMPLPQHSEIQALVESKQPAINESILASISTALSGLNENEIQKLLVLLQNRFGALEQHHLGEILAEIQYQKEQIIAKSGVLEMVKVDQQLEDIGGLEHLKKWLQDQSHILSRLSEALKFGVKAPKGALIAGMPGCGKSLTAKAAAALFQQPLLRLDIGSLLGKYVGESETNMRKALAMAESISPCVLWVDELEKAFVGMTGKNASEVSSRLLGYFLTWLQEKTKPVFIMATANDITALPPELLRKGRFDEIFYVGFPNQTERKKILEIHLSKAKQTASDFNLIELAQLCRDYSGADIENAVYESVKTAFLSTDQQLTQERIKHAIKNTVPLRKTLKDKVGEYEKKFDELYLTPASKNDGLSIAQMQKMAKDPNYLERKKVAEDAEVTEDILELLVKDKELDVRKAAFANPNCPTKLLDEQVQLGYGNEGYHRDLIDIITKHPNISFALAVKMCCGSEEYLMNLVKNVDLKLLENQNILMESDTTKKVLIVEEKELQPKILSRLLSDKSGYVRTILAEHSKLSEAQQLTLFEKGENDSINLAFLKNKYNKGLAQSIESKLYKKWERYYSPYYREHKEKLETLINYPYLKPSTQISISGNTYYEARMDLAKHLNLSEEVQLKLSEDSHYTVREKLAKNVNITEQVQLKLAEDSDSYVRKALFRNPNITERVREKLK